MMSTRLKIVVVNHDRRSQRKRVCDILVTTVYIIILSIAIVEVWVSAIMMGGDNVCTDAGHFRSWILNAFNVFITFLDISAPILLSMAHVFNEYAFFS